MATLAPLAGTTQTRTNRGCGDYYRFPGIVNSFSVMVLRTKRDMHYSTSEEWPAAGEVTAQKMLAFGPPDQQNLLHGVSVMFTVRRGLCPCRRDESESGLIFQWSGPAGKIMY